MARSILQILWNWRTARSTLDAEPSDLISWSDRNHRHFREIQPVSMIVGNHERGAPNFQPLSRMVVSNLCYQSVWAAVTSNSYCEFKGSRVESM